MVAAERRSSAALALLVVVALGAGAFFFLHGRGLTFYFDEWAIVIDRQDWSVDTFLQPHNEHLHLTAVLVYKLLLATIGLEAYEPYRALVLVLHVTVALLVFALVRRRIGDVLALVAVVPLLFLGTGWENVMWPFQIGLLGSLAAGLGALLLIERRSTAADAGAALLLALALASASVAVPIALAVAVELLWEPARRRRLWVAAGPMALYALWAIAYGRSTVLASNLAAAPRFVADTAAATVGGLLGLGPEWGAIVLLVGLLWLSGSFVQERLAVTPRLASVALALVASWILTALARAHLGGAASSRYVYVGAVFLLLIVAELARGAVVRQRMLALLAALVAISLAGNYAALRDGLAHLRTYNAVVEAALGGLELAGPETDPGFRPAPEHAPNIYAEAYFEAVASYGSPAPAVEELLLRRDEDLHVADAVYVTARDVRPEAVTATGRGEAPPAIDDLHAGRAETAGSCVAFVPTAPGAALDVTLPGRTFTVAAADNAHVDVHVALLAQAFGATPALLVPGESTVRIALPPPVAQRRWRVRLSSTERVEACTVPDP